MDSKPASGDTRESREASFWDALVDRDTPKISSTQSSLNWLAKRHADQLGDLAGKKVLDIGCGVGFWSLYMASKGAHVWGVDISPRSIEEAKLNSERAGLADRINLSVMSATALEFSDCFFDLVQGYDIMHHVDSRLLGQEIARVLTDQGEAVFTENCANNPLLMFARNHICGRWGVSKWSSDDEYPLTRAAVHNFAQYFHSLEIDYPFRCFHYFDAKLWKYRNAMVSRACAKMDRFIDRHVSFLKQYSYRQIIHCRQPVSK